MAVPARFKSNRIDSAIDFRLTEYGCDLLVQRSIGGEVGDLETNCFGVRKADRVNVANDDYGGTQQPSRCLLYTSPSPRD